MLSNSSKYALKAVLYLAVNSSKTKKILAKNISKPTNIPKPYLSKILQELAKHDIVSSVRGPHGGFYLSDKNRAQPVMLIVDVIDGKKRIESCMLSLEDCNENKPCPLHELVGPMRTKFIKSLENKTIEALASALKNKKAFLPL